MPSVEDSQELERCHNLSSDLVAAAATIREASKERDLISGGSVSFFRDH